MSSEVSRREVLKGLAALSTIGSLHAHNLQDKLILLGSTIAVQSQQPYFLEYAVHDFASYLGELSGRPVSVCTAEKAGANCRIFVGKQLAEQQGITVGPDLGEEGFVIQTKGEAYGGNTCIVVAGFTPQGTRSGVIALMRMIRFDGTAPFVDAQLNIRNKPHLRVRALHLNGWATNYPYTFRSWSEENWKSFIDLAGYQGTNLLFLWPFMEIMPVPLSRNDEAYLHEVHRVVDYAHKNHNMEVWIMHSTNRIAVSTCGSDNPRTRPYWVTGCQQDMNPEDPEQFKRIVTSLESLYRIVNNADGFGMIDSDPGGWPQSPLTDQLKIFSTARQLLDQYSEKGRETKLIDWMWFGWGRHKYFNSTRTVAAEYDWNGEKNPDADDVAYMVKTIEGFRTTLHEPWWLIAGFSPYLQASQREGVLEKTVFMPYGAIEGEPSFPMTNISMEPVRRALSILDGYPGVAGIMGNNMAPLLQLPRTYYLLRSAWDPLYCSRGQSEVLADLAGELYVDNAALIAKGFLTLQANTVDEITTVLSQLEKQLASQSHWRLGVLGRKIFPTSNQIIDDLISQLNIKKAQCALIAAVNAGASIRTCSEAVEEYFDRLLAWSQRTGWDKMIRIGMWRAPIYPSSDKSFMHAVAGLKGIITNGHSDQSTYDRIAAFFSPIADKLSRKYGSDSAMVCCVEPMKLAVLEAAS